MARRKLTYSEGDWFAVPLKDGGYGIGLAARVGRRGAVFGYFYGPRHPNIPKSDDTQFLNAENAILLGIFGDLGLLDSSWPIIRKSDEWDRTKWPLPAFGRIDSLDPNLGFRTVYEENNLLEIISEKEVSAREAASLTEDGLYGYISLANYLNKLIG